MSDRDIYVSWWNIVTYISRINYCLQISALISVKLHSYNMQETKNSLWVKKLNYLLFFRERTPEPLIDAPHPAMHGRCEVKETVIHTTVLGTSGSTCSPPSRAWTLWSDGDRDTYYNVGDVWWHMFSTQPCMDAVKWWRQRYILQCWGRLVKHVPHPPVHGRCEV